ncbi:hypothetical protein [Pseudohongiella acticola]|jgi:hypothetical protein|uniref:hypothetical protein n=1 Tax=Pseudohongiella acticola TaxID=1524254 RepID=UPI0030ED1CE1|tara:strand:+ start:700 stop:1200 length:501 start_codon:yes stop_codon:yes gene_type:complete
MLLDKSSFYIELCSFTVLPGVIDQVTTEAFAQVFGSPEARKWRNIVYLLLTEEPIPRVLGESNIVYIGQTKQSFRNRYFRYSGLFANGTANKHKYGNIIEHYGPMRIAVGTFERYGNSLREAECQLLWWYFQNHCEYPPVNYSKATIYNDVRETTKGPSGQSIATN